MKNSDDQSSAHRRIITDNNTLRALYHDLVPGDMFVGRVRMLPSEENLLLDLLERGIRFFPSALAQLASRSKALQAKIFFEFMPPCTKAVHDLHGLLEVINFFNEKSISQVVTKHDRKNGGMGILRWNSVEEVFNHCSTNSLRFPLVVQPFLADAVDIRVIMLGDYQEAYRRINPHNFRNNLHCGGSSEPYELTSEQRQLCIRVMERGKFPYGHIDLLVTESGTSYLSEINLRGGLRGAKISPAAYRAKVAAINEAARKGEIGGNFITKTGYTEIDVTR